MADNLAFELNGEEDEDAAIRRAIALSMGEELPEEKKVDGAPDEFDSELEIIDSPAGMKENPSRSAPKISEDTASERRESCPPASSFSALGLDRKRMEEERLARLNKRKASDPDLDAAKPPAQRQKISANPTGPRVATKREETADVRTSGEAKPIPAPSTGLKSIPYAKGIIRRTWAFGKPRAAARDIKIEELFQKEDLELAVLSSFQWDDEWLMSKLNLKKTKVVLIAFAQDEAQREAMRSNVPRDIIRFCFPPMEGVNCMHSKLQLLKFPTHLRVVLPTGNLVPYDWGETGVMENMVFAVDLPRLEDPDQRERNELTPFGKELAYFLDAQGLDEKLIKSLHNYDFSETARFGFVHTIGGSHLQDASWKRTGYCGLGRTVKALGLQSEGTIEVDFVCSSLGSINYDFLTALYYACQGDSGMKEYQSRTSRSRKGKDAREANQATAIQGHFRAYFPSHETVLESRGGRNSAGTICFRSRWWNQPSFPREILRDFKSSRKGLLTHSKIMFVRRGTTSAPQSAPGWAYIGSANLSESAWGRLVKDRTSGHPKLTCRNWECGVLVPATTLSMSERANMQRPDDDPRMLDMFNATMPVPIELPGAVYDARDAKHPWFFMGD